MRDRRPQLALGAGLIVMVVASIWAPAQPELLVTGACNVAPCGSLEDPQRWRTAWIVWAVGAVLTLGATTALSCRHPRTRWQRAALAAAAVICLPVTAVVAAVISLFSSVQGFSTVMWAFSVLPLVAVATLTIRSMAAPDRRLTRPDTT